MARITVDTNILVRAVNEDDPIQSRIARKVLQKDFVVVPIMALCEFVWVLSRAYKIPLKGIAVAIRSITEDKNVHVDRLAVAAGLAMLDAGSDFADGVIAHEGARHGGEMLVSFDRRAVARLNGLGFRAQLAD